MRVSRATDMPDLSAPIVVLGTFVLFPSTTGTPLSSVFVSLSHQPLFAALLAGAGGSGKSLALRRLMALQKTGKVEPLIDADVVPSVSVANERKR